MPKKISKGKHVLFLKLRSTSYTPSSSFSSSFHIPEPPPSASLSSSSSSPPHSSLFSMESAVLTLELTGPSSFDHLELLAYEIYLPLLTNPQNQAKWGETATKEVSFFFISYFDFYTAYLLRMLN